MLKTETDLPGREGKTETDTPLSADVRGQGSRDYFADPQAGRLDNALKNLLKYKGALKRGIKEVL